MDSFLQEDFLWARVQNDTKETGIWQFFDYDDDMSPAAIIASLQNGTTQQTLRNYGITRLGLFGSYVRGEGSDDSGIDLLYDIDYDKPYQGWGPISALGFLEKFWAKDRSY